MPHLSRAFAVALTLLAALPARAETVLRFVPHADLRILDPVWTTGYITRNHGYMVYDTLFALDAQLKPQPQMVETWSVSADGLTYDFTLRPGLTFHDGAPVRPADCIASLQRWGKRDTAGQKLMDSVAALEPNGERGFTLRLRSPYGYVIESLAKLSSNVPFIMRAQEAATDPFKQITAVIGSGPFQWVPDEFNPGLKAVYRKFAGYVPRAEPPSLAAGGKVAKVDRVEWIYLPDGSTAVSALAKGEVDWIEVPVPDLVPLLEKTAGVTVEAIDTLGSDGILRFNFLYPPFDNVKARQALLYGTAQADYMNAVVGDPRYWKPCSSFFPCGTPYERDAGGLLVTKDLAKAKRLWREAGFTGAVVVLDPTDYGLHHQQALVAADALRQIGATVELRAMDWTSLLAVRAKKDPPAQGGWNLFPTRTVAPDLMSPLLNDQMRASGDKAWVGWPSDAALEQLRDQWIAATSPEAQREIAARLADRAFEFVPYVVSGQFTTPTAHRSTVTGLVQSPIPFLWNVTKP